MKVFILEFSFFSSLLWDDRTIKITALSRFQLIRAFILATKYISDPHSGRSEREIRRECWHDHLEDIQEEELTFPIIDSLYD